MSLRVVAWRVAAILWAAKIFYLSTHSFSGEHTQSLLAEFLSLLSLSFSREFFLVLHAIARKLAHLFEYGVFAFIIYQALAGAGPGRWRSNLAAWSIGIAAAYSLTDEFHQFFVRGRGASLLDCSLDAAGAAIAMMLLYWRSERWPRRSDSSIT